MGVQMTIAQGATEHRAGVPPCGTLGLGMSPRIDGQSGTLLPMLSPRLDICDHCI